eukprot:COSAG02_NODE_4061_length_5844_cov_2.549869_3_plen_249_part_00
MHVLGIIWVSTLLLLSITNLWISLVALYQACFQCLPSLDPIIVDAGLNLAGVWNPGEHGEWEKKSCFDLVVRVPLMIHVPGMSHTWGTRTSALVELVDIMPTVSALAGLPLPAGVDGEDQSALFHSASTPSSANSSPMSVSQEVKAAAYHQYPACNMDVSKGFNVTRGACNNAEKHTFNYMGYTVRTAQWRYTAWFLWQNKTLSADFAGPHASELYNHSGDNSYEMDNYENQVRLTGAEIREIESHSQ